MRQTVSWQDVVIQRPQFFEYIVGVKELSLKGGVSLAWDATIAAIVVSGRSNPR